MSYTQGGVTLRVVVWCVCGTIVGIVVLFVGDTICSMTVGKVKGVFFVSMVCLSG